MARRVGHLSLVDWADPGDVILLNRSDPFFVDCSNSSVN